MRVCLINPPRIQPRAWGKPSVVQPIGLAYIAAVLEQRHEVRIIDAPAEGWRNLLQTDGTKYRAGLTNAEIADRIREWSPNVVVIEIPFSGWIKPAFEVAAIVKGIAKSIFVVLEGQHPSARPRDCLANSDVDFVVIGEPENTVLELVDSFEVGGPDFNAIKGIGFVKENVPIITSPRPCVEDLNSLPFPSRKLLPMREYFAAVKVTPLRGEIYRPWTEILTSRGCPYNCVFCTHHIVWGKKWRGRSPENVVDEIEEVVKTYHIRQIDFLDDNMTLDPKRMEGICDLIVERKLKIAWFTPNGVRADTLSERLLTKMKKSGCKKIRVAPESGVQHVVDKIIKKNLDLKSVERAVALCKKVGIRVGCFFVIGLIGETKEDIKETIKFAYRLRKLGAESFVFSIATPIQGTELYEQAKRGGFLRDCYSDEALAAAEPLIETPEFTANELRELCMQANLVNPTFTPDKILRAVRNPKKTVKTLLGRN